jgi:hypothetical protein
MKYMYADAGCGGFVLARIDGGYVIMADFNVTPHYVDRAFEALMTILNGGAPLDYIDWVDVEPEAVERVAELFRVALLAKSH